MENMFDTAAKIAGLTKKQYREWRKSEALEPKRENRRGRSVSKRRKRNARSQEKREAEQKRIDKEREKKQRRSVDSRGKGKEFRKAMQKEKRGKKKTHQTNLRKKLRRQKKEREVEANSEANGGATEDTETTAATATIWKEATPNEEPKGTQRKNVTKGIPTAKRNTGRIHR